MYLEKVLHKVTVCGFKNVEVWGAERGEKGQEKIRLIVKTTAHPVTGAVIQLFQYPDF